MVVTEIRKDFLMTGTGLHGGFIPPAANEKSKEDWSMKLKMKRVLGVLLALALVIGLLPEMNLTAYAGTGAYSSLIPEGNDDATALANKVVTFNGIEWYIIKDESQGESSGTVTLLAKDPISASKFHGSSNSYDGSMVKEDLVRLLTAEGANSFKGVADAINPVTLTTHAYNSTTVVKETIENAKLWLLSISEAKDLPENVRKCSQNGGDGNFWWLRSPGGDDDYAACVSGGDGYVGGYGRNVTSSCGVRPALQLNLSSSHLLIVHSRLSRPRIKIWSITAIIRIS